MAVLQESMSKSVNPFAELVKDDPAPAGAWIATVIDVRDQFGVERPSFENPQVTEVVDLTTFLFGYRDQAGQPHRIASKTMRISGNEKSNLFGFLKSALGATPKYGWDYCEMKGRKVLLTIAHEPRRSGQGTYPTIAALCPVPTGMAGAVGSPQLAVGNVQPGQAPHGDNAIGQTGVTLNAQPQAPGSAVGNAQPAMGNGQAGNDDDGPLPF